MIPAPFDYLRPDSVEGAIRLLAQYGDEAKLLAGGHSLLPLLKLRLATPAVVVDVGRLRELCYVRVEDGEVAIGALTRHRDLETSAVLAVHAPLIGYVAGLVGDPQVRHRGTIGGSLAHGDPAADLPAAVLALGGRLVLAGPEGRREVAATDFFTGFLETALDPEEMLLEVRVPRSVAVVDGAGPGWAYEKFGRRSNEWAIVGAAVVLGPRPGVALVNMAPTPVRAGAVEAVLAVGGAAETAADAAAEGTSPVSDINGSAEYRRHLARLLVRRALVRAAGHPAGRDPGGAIGPGGGR